MLGLKLSVFLMYSVLYPVLSSSLQSLEVCDDQDRPSRLLLVFNNDETKSQTSYLGEEFKKATGCDQ